MAESDFILAVGPDGKTRRVPAHYIDNPTFGFTLPEPEEVREPAASAKTKVTEPAAAGEKKEARS